MWNDTQVNVHPRNLNSTAYLYCSCRAAAMCWASCRRLRYPKHSRMMSCLSSGRRESHLNRRRCLPWEHSMPPWSIWVREPRGRLWHHNRTRRRRWHGPLLLLVVLLYGSRLLRLPHWWRWCLLNWIEWACQGVMLQDCEWFHDDWKTTFCQYHSKQITDKSEINSQFKLYSACSSWIHTHILLSLGESKSIGQNIGVTVGEDSQW